MSSADDMVTMDTSALLVLLNTIRLTAVGHNVVQFTKVEPHGDLPRSLGTGVAVTLGQVMLSADTDTDFDTYQSALW